MITPYAADLTIDVGAYHAMVAWYLQHSVGGLYANCLSSEMDLLDDRERLLLVSEAVRAAAGRVPVAATGNLGVTQAQHVELCRRVAAAGADIVMLVIPEWCGTDAELERYCMAMAEQVDAPLGLYECPIPRPYHLGVALVERLARTGRFVAYKETSCDLSKIHALLQATSGTPLALLQANTPYLLESVRVGAPGTMSIASIWLPDLVAAVIERGHAQAADAEQLHDALCTMELAQRAVHPQGSKYLLSKRGPAISTRTRRRQPPLSAEEQRALDAAARAWMRPDGTLQILEAVAGP
jgi:4-hydroxy-tetrahydrodipicolinate synthase